MIEKLLASFSGHGVVCIAEIVKNSHCTLMEHRSYDCQELSRIRLNFNREKQSEFSSRQATISILVKHAQYRFFVIFHLLYRHLLYPQSQQQQLHHAADQTTSF